MSGFCNREWLEESVASSRYYYERLETREEGKDSDDVFIGVSSLMKYSQKRYAVREPVGEIRKFCRLRLEPMVPRLKQLDFSSKTVKVEDGMRPSDARELAEAHGGEWTMATGQYAGVEYTTINQPNILHMKSI